MKTKLISKKELKALNKEITAACGTLNGIVSGSCVELENGEVHYYIDLRDSNVYKPNATLRKIGNCLKETAGADEVYFLGEKIA